MIKRSASLLLFEEALEQLSATENNKKKVILWMHDHRDMVYALGTTYLKKKGMEKAIYAYILEILLSGFELVGLRFILMLVRMNALIGYRKNRHNWGTLVPQKHHRE